MKTSCSLPLEPFKTSQGFVELPDRFFGIALQEADPAQFRPNKSEVLGRTEPTQSFFGDPEVPFGLLETRRIGL